MRNKRLLKLVLGILSACVFSPTARAEKRLDPAKLAAKIDARLAAEWDKNGVKQVPETDDATFLRRATLDLCGRIPTVAEVRAYLDDRSPDKRARLIDRLIESGGHTRHMATFWRRVWVPQADTPEYARLSDDFEVWVAARLQDNTPYNQIVLELLTMPEGKGNRAAVSPAGFFAANENKPENLAAFATRGFLGVNLDCAQCHNHPFARWTQDQFWKTAAFFAPATKAANGNVKLPELVIPNTKKTATPLLLDGAMVSWPTESKPETGRKLLGDWLTSKNNPYFARNAVNRLWANMFGAALVEPLDDLSGDEANSGFQSELLGELAEEYAAGGFDLKNLTKALAMTRAYRKTAGAGDGRSAEARLFSRMPVRGMTGEQLYDSLRTAAGLSSERADVGRGQGLEARKRFAARFLVARPVSAERSITQSLSMMNGQLTTELADPSKNATLDGAANAPFLDTAGKIETLFLATLGRKPTDKEKTTMIAHVEAATESNRGRALGDVFWALVNSTEFNTNH